MKCKINCDVRKKRSERRSQILIPFIAIGIYLDEWKDKKHEDVGLMEMRIALLPREDRSICIIGLCQAAQLGWPKKSKPLSTISIKSY